MSARVELWRDLCDQNGGDIPTPFMLAWIDWESDGSPRSWTYLGEAGIFQLDPSNMKSVGVSAEQLHATTEFAGLTDDQKSIQVTSGVDYINWCRNFAGQFAQWDQGGVDYWRLVKMVHNLPATVRAYAPGTSSWEEFAAKYTAAGWPSKHLNEAAQVGLGIGRSGTSYGDVGAAGSPVDLGQGGGIDPWLLLGLATLAIALFLLPRFLH